VSKDLNAPLLGIAGKPVPKWKRWIGAIPVGFIGMSLIVGTLTTGVIWTSMVDDPRGGEPVAVVSLDRTRGLGLEGQSVQVGPQGGAQPIKVAEPDDARKPPKAQGVDPARIGGGAQVGAALSTTPLREVTEMGRHGPIPKIGPDGLRPMDVYARPVGREADASARVVIVVGGLGLSQTGTDLALRSLPGAVTLAFSPYGTSLERWIARSRTNGHEILLQMPMEPFDFPDNDPGPQTLLATLPGEANVDRMHWVLSRASNYAGVINYLGARFTSDAEAMRPVLKDLAARGLFYLDDGVSTRSVAGDVARSEAVPFLKADVLIDAVANEEAIEARLAQLEQLARQRGIAVGVASALPVSVRRLSEWIKTLEARGIALVPATVGARGGQS
jgi:hypothetical protein